MWPPKYAVPSVDPRAMAMAKEHYEAALASLFSACESLAATGQVPAVFSALDCANHIHDVLGSFDAKTAAACLHRIPVTVLINTLRFATEQGDAFSGRCTPYIHGVLRLGTKYLNVSTGLEAREIAELIKRVKPPH